MRSTIRRLSMLGIFAFVAQGSPWKAGGSAPSAYVIVTNAGWVLDASGATLTLRSDTAAPSAFGTISGSIAADSFRLRRVRITADVDAKGVTGGASPWLRVDGESGMIALDNGSDEAVRGTDSGHRQITMYVPANATRLVFGLLLSGRGEATLRALHLDSRTVDASAPITADAQRELDSAFAIARRSALWRDTVTWSRIEPDVRVVAAGAEAPAETYPAIRLLLTRLGDHHSFLMKPTGARQFQTSGARNPRPSIRALDDGIGYVSVPAYSGGEQSAMHAYAKDVHDSLVAILPRTGGGCKWVVDLRDNGGGNMWPMLGGLAPFLGNAGLGSFVSGGGSGPLWHANAVDVGPPGPLAGLDSAYVAVLTGPRTASSGEAVTISFRGRPRTRSFGLPTAGLSTANQSYALPDGAMIFLTTAVEADRTGKRYGEKIEPDETIAAAASGAVGDPQLERAASWLKSQPRCP